MSNNSPGAFWRFLFGDNFLTTEQRTERVDIIGSPPKGLYHVSMTYHMMYRGVRAWRSGAQSLEPNVISYMNGALDRLMEYDMDIQNGDWSRVDRLGFGAWVATFEWALPKACSELMNRQAAVVKAGRFDESLSAANSAMTMLFLEYNRTYEVIQ